METVQRIRELEKSAKEDVKNINGILKIRQFITNSEESNDVRIAAIHSLRRVTMHYVENGLYYKPVPKTGAGTATKIKEYNSWFQKQFVTFKDCLIDLIASDQDAFHAVAIRTYIELMKVDAFVEHGPDATPQFNLESFKALLYALTVNKNEIDVDLLLMLKEEIFDLNDCTYAALVCLREIITEVKDAQAQAEQRAQLNRTKGKGSNVTTDPISANFDTIRKNFIDLLRVIELPDELDEENVLVPLVKPTKSGGEEDSSGDEGDGGDSSDEEREKAVQEQRREAALQKVDPLLAELAGLKGKKRGAGGDGKSGKRARRALTLYDKLTDLVHYQRAFSKAWLSLLALPFTPAQHKLLLKHLPERVVPNLRNPLLLADYLTSSYSTGGMAAVLALESLFHLIVHHNLDYPGFFLSLYNLCTVEVFSAKYRGKFMKLLSTSLKSVNLPAYLVAAFAKRLAHIALHSPTPNAQFCVAQCTWLLRQHPQAQVLIHRKARVANGDGKYGSGVEFDNTESTDLEKTHALSSSLWEMELLQQHHLYAAAQLAASLTTPESTMVTAAAGAAYVHVEDHLNVGYADLMDAALAVTASKKEGAGAGRREAALSYVKPTSLFAAGSTAGECFGMVV